MWSRALDGFVHEGVGVEWRVKVKVFSLWLEKNNEGWGPNNIQRALLENACKTFSQRIPLLVPCLRVELAGAGRGRSESIRKVSFTS